MEIEKYLRPYTVRFATVVLLVAVGVKSLALAS
jgi:hypothetical protein